MKSSVSSFWDSDIKMIKRIISAVLLLILISGCNSSETIEAPKAQEFSTPKVEIKATSTKGASATSESSTVTDTAKPPKAEEASIVAAPTTTPKPGVVERVVEKAKKVFSTVQKTPTTTPTVTVKDSAKPSLSDSKPESKPDVPASFKTPDLTVNSYGSGRNHLTTVEDELVLSPPKSATITMDHNPTAGNVLVSAAEGTVPPDASVLVANMELGNAAVVKANSKGAFGVTIPAHAGTHLLVKQDSKTQGSSVIKSGLKEIFQTEQLGSPGIVLRVPVVKSAAKPAGYSIAGGARVTDDGPPWVFEGNLSDIAFQPNGTFNLTGQIKVLTDFQPLDEISLSFSGQILGDEDGYHIGPSGDFVSTIMTPTGLTIGEFRNKNLIYSKKIAIQGTLDGEKTMML